MKRPILFAILVVVLAFCYCFWGLTPKEKTAETPAASATARPTIANAPTPAATTTQPVIQGKAPVMLTDERRRIMDSPDLMATVATIRKEGTQDEKDWALFITAGCVTVRAASRAADASSSVPAKSGSTSDESQVAAERRQAFEMLAPRCKGIFQLGTEARAALKSDLIAGSETNPSVLGRLHALVASQDNRWSDDQAKLITSALYSDDPILVREAFYAAQGAIDKDTSGGADRSRAFELAFPAEVVSGQLSEFERLGACYVTKLCPSTADQFVDHSPTNANIERLEGQFKAALRDHKSVRDVLAIN